MPAPLPAAVRWVCRHCGGPRPARRGATRPAGGHGLCSGCYCAWDYAGRRWENGEPAVPLRRGQPGWESPAKLERRDKILDRIGLGRSAALICQELHISERTYERYRKALKEKGMI